MWVRVGSFSVKPGTSETLRATYNERAVPLVRSSPGNLACLLLEPESEDQPFLAITVWRDRTAAEGYEASGQAASVVGLVREFFAGPPSLRSYESRSDAGLPG